MNMQTATDCIERTVDDVMDEKHGGAPCDVR